MSDKDTYRGVWIKVRAECIRAAFDRYLAREPEKAIEHINDKLAWASRLEEQRAESRITI